MTKAQRTVLVLAAATLIWSVAPTAAYPKDSSANDLVADGVKLYTDGKDRKALASFQKALALEEGHAPAAHGAASILFVGGKFQDAQDTLQKYLLKVSTDRYAWMLAWICQERAGYGERAMLSQVGALVDEHSWFGETLNLFLGHLTPEAYIKRVGGNGAVDPKTTGKGEAVKALIEKRARKACTARFFAAEACASRGNRAKAREYFQAAIDSQKGFQWEKEMARAELARFKEKTK